jgi:hypothetical protein
MKVTDYFQLFLDIQARDWQREVFKEVMEVPMYGLISSRQVGKSTIISLVALCLALGYTGMDGNYVPAHSVLIVSKDRATAKQLIAMVRQHIRAIEAITGEPVARSDMGGINDVYLLNGMRLVSMPGTPRSLQGFTGSVIVDELSANRWSIEEMMGQAMSVTSARDYFKLIVVTNADVQGSYVHSFFESEEATWVEQRKNWKLKALNVYDIYGVELPERLKKRKAAMSKAMWERFYENKFIGSSSGLIDRDQLPILKARPEGRIRYCLCIDPGFSDKGNPTGVALIGYVDGSFFVQGDLWFNKTLEEQERLISELIKTYRPEKLFIDMGAQGYHLAKRFENYGGFEKVNVSNKYLKQNFHTLTNILEERKLSLLDSSGGGLLASYKYSISVPHIIEDFCSVASGERDELVFPQRPVKSTDRELITAGGLPTNKIHSDALIACLYGMTWAAGLRVGPRGVTSYGAIR